MEIAPCLAAMDVANVMVKSTDIVRPKRKLPLYIMTKLGMIKH